MNLVQKKTKRGFTIVELMVVMSVMAVMSAMGISSLVRLNNVSVADRAAEIILSEIREAQNKSFSVSSSPSDSAVFPVAWAVKIEEVISPTNYENQIQSQYLNYNGTAYSQASYNTSREAIFTDSGFEPIEITKIVGNTTTAYSEPLYLYYATPFGKFFATNANNESAQSSAFSQLTDRPKNTEITTTKAAYEILIKYRNTEKVISIGENGDAFISR